MSRKNLIVSFIGGSDIKYLPPIEDNVSPILRLLMGLPGGMRPENTQLLLFIEGNRKEVQNRFCDSLQAALPSLGLSKLEIKRVPIELPEGPTDLNALYEQVWHSIPISGRAKAQQIVFHISSGTWAMQLTLVLAANCLRLEGVSLIETSRQQGVREVRPPYVLAAREVRSDRVARRASKLPAKASRKLLKNSVIEDPAVHTVYAALYKAASNSKLPQRLVIQGAEGCGKWHAGRQFAEWRGQNVVQWLAPDWENEVEKNITLLIRWLDMWSEQDLRKLSLLAAQRPDIAIVATYRTDHPPAVPLMVLMRDGLRGAVQLVLPSLGSRTDVVAMAESMARELGMLDGKIKNRLQFELFTDVYPRNIYDLKELLATAAVYSDGAHAQHSAYLQVRQVRDTQALQAELCKILINMDFGPQRHKLNDVVRLIKAVVVTRALSEGRSQEEVARMLGYEQSTVSDIYKTRMDLTLWKEFLDPDADTE